MKSLQRRARALRLHGLLAQWDEIATADWLPELVEHEERQQHLHSLERRRAQSRIPPFKPVADFDWNWPRQILRSRVQTLLGLDFLRQHHNVVLIGAPGTGKTMIAANLAHQALLGGFTVRLENTPGLLDNLAAIRDPRLLHHRLTLLARPRLLVLDEIGFLAYAPRQADLLFHIISRRHQRRSTLATASRSFREWETLFPDAACLVGLLDRLLDHATIITIEADSWRLRNTRNPQEIAP